MFELRLVCPESRIEALCDTLAELDALSVSVEDADAQTDAEQALFGEPGEPLVAQGWQRSRVCALFADQTLAQEAWTALQSQAMYADCTNPSVVEIAQQDWVRLTQAQFSPVEITPEFWIVPSWHQPPAQARVVMRLDPGLAFGTGTHPTTRMCLRWLARRAQGSTSGLRGLRVLDYGCGSGILAVASALWGATEIDAVDIDASAVESTRVNAAGNGVCLHAGLPESAQGVYALVLANILATPLKVLAPLLWSHVQAGGSLVLAGILARQADELKAAYAAYADLAVADEEDGWILMTATR